MISFGDDEQQLVSSTRRHTNFSKKAEKMEKSVLLPTFTLGKKLLKKKKKEVVHSPNVAGGAKRNERKKKILTADRSG